MEGRDRKKELEDMLYYASYFQKANEAKLSTPKLCEKMSHICNLETDVVTVFFVEFFAYADEQQLGEDEIFKVIDLIENYWARRVVCGLTSSGLTPLFFFVEFFAYADEQQLGEDEIFKVIDLIENYWARRVVCGLTSSGLTPLFCSLHKEVLKSIEEYRSANVPMNFSYCDVATYHIVRRDGKKQIPKDTMFQDGIRGRNEDVMRIRCPKLLSASYLNV